MQMAAPNASTCRQWPLSLRLRSMPKSRAPRKGIGLRKGWRVRCVIGPQESGRMAWIDFLFSALENPSVREGQHINGHSAAQLCQDVASDASLAADGNVSRGLKKVILLTRTVNYQADNGTSRPMTLDQVTAAKKGCGDVVSIANNTPPDAKFLSNSDTSNHAACNWLTVPSSAAVIACPTQPTPPAPAWCRLD